MKGCAVMTWANAVRAALIGTAVLSMASTPTLADTTTLICNRDAPNDPWKEIEPTTVQLNEAQSYVTVHWGAKTSSFDSAPAFSIGPLRATFTSDTISFNINAYPDVVTINRLTGRMLLTFSSGGYWSWACESGKAKF